MTMNKRAKSRTAYMPVRPDGDWWVAGCDSTPAAASAAICAHEGLVSWDEIEASGWSIVAVKIRLLG